MQTGTKISLAGHGLLLGWAAIGGWFQSSPPPLKVQEVSLISAEEFARLSQQRQAPVVAPDASVLAPPEDSAAPEVSLPPEPRPEPEASAVPPEPLPEPTPDPVVEDLPADLPEVQPDAVVPDTAPQVEALPETAVVLPPQPETPQPRPVDRVAPVPIAPPEPDRAVDEIEQPDVAPDAGADVPQEVQEATAPEAASDRIVTEENQGDEQSVSAPVQSVRPKARPQRRAADPTPADTGAESPTGRSAVEDALAAALAQGGEVEAPEPAGPPLTSGEKDALRVAVSQCWNVGSLSSDALRTTVVVGVTLAQDGKPDSGSIRMLSSTGGSAEAAQQAYGAARRAIIRCGSRGFQLPPDKYAHWRDIEMTFNPERMRIK